MGWLIERVIENIDILMAAAAITSGVRKLLFCVPILLLVSSCTYTIRESQDAIGASTTSYALAWGDNTPEAVHPNRAERPVMEEPVPSPTPYLGSMNLTSPKEPWDFVD
jgi:hypothetical protein